MSRLFSILVVVANILIIGFNSNAQTNELNPDSLTKGKLSYWAYDLIQIPELKVVDNPKPIIIAVIDDGFRLSHKDLKDFIYLNSNELKNNYTDDDENGFIDDYSGWDVSDNDNNVYPPQGLENSFFHGTFICGVITTILKKSYGDIASKYFKILPIKASSDNSENVLILDGYKGIEYAMAMNADIICCAWSGGTPTKDEKTIVEEARKNGVLIVGSAGNHYSQQVDAPASLPGVMAIGALDTSLIKTIPSNYGIRMDLVAPGEKIRAAYPLADNAYFYGSGTSGAAAIVTGCVAILKAVKKESSNSDIYDALTNTASPVDGLNAGLCGKLGAGYPNLTKAVDFLQNVENRPQLFNPKITKGKIYFDKSSPIQHWKIEPDGAFQGFNIKIEGQEGKLSKNSLEIRTKDSLYAKFSVEKFPNVFFVPGSSVEIKYVAVKKMLKNQLMLSYSAIAIDSSTLYCNDVKYIGQTDSVFSDGSDRENYANNSACKWIITAPEGKRIKIEFKKFNTQAKVDFVYLFDGKSSISENIIAKYSGSKLPPVVVSRTNQVLVWFVTDKTITEDGWELKYQFVD